MDASCLERSCVWSLMCAEVVRRDRDASSSYLLAVMRTWAGSVVNRKLRMSRIRNA
ncbi:hypothetical protein Bca52824_078108 [Brassica carinata]|uniref:Uncharacterized protein n=1 Tax=Brassica carinata TaxID=52824 RepID=A0A8X7PUV5_BRACI|nr:hypothetical protein Bca52824_078108 [Brassica carinata]